MTSSQQSGLSLSVFLVWCALFVVVALVGFKLGPAYVEDATIKKHLRSIAKDAAFVNGGRKGIEGAFSSRALIDRITVISAKDIHIEKSGTGVILSARYTTCVPLLHNISACMDFNPSSQ